MYGFLCQSDVYAIHPSQSWLVKMTLIRPLVPAEATHAEANVATDATSSGIYQFQLSVCSSKVGIAPEEAVLEIA